MEDIQGRIDRMVEEFRVRYSKEWFDIVDAEALGLVGRIIDGNDRDVEILGKKMKISDIYQVLIRSKKYWRAVLERQKSVYMYKSLVEGMRGVIRSSREGDIKSVKLLADLMLKGKLENIDNDGEVDDIFSVGDEELKEELRSRNNE